MAMASEEELQREEEQMRFLKWLADTTVWRLTVGPITQAQGEEIIQETRKQVFLFFPDTEDLFDLILRPRFERALREHIEEEFWRKLTA
jgi:hypothetical protein